MKNWDVVDKKKRCAAASHDFTHRLCLIESFPWSPTQLLCVFLVLLCLACKHCPSSLHRAFGKICAVLYDSNSICARGCCSHLPLLPCRLKPDGGMGAGSCVCVCVASSYSRFMLRIFMPFLHPYFLLCLISMHVFMWWSLRCRGRFKCPFACLGTSLGWFRHKWNAAAD